jgi:hypothetical protein
MAIGVGAVCCTCCCRIPHLPLAFQPKIARMHASHTREMPAMPDMCLIMTVLEVQLRAQAGPTNFLLISIPTQQQARAAIVRV